MHPTKKLGKLPRKHDARNLLFHKYSVALPAPPLSVNWGNKVSNWGMMLNDQLGDCTIAGISHALMTWTTDALGQAVVVPDPIIQQVYSELSGYDPATGANDNGCAELDVLNYFRKTGIDGHKITAWAQVDPTNDMHLKQAIDLFGCAYMGVNLPASAMDQEKEWTIVPGSPDEGGHCIIYVAYDADTYTCVSWGEAIKVANDFHHKYVDECYVMLSPDWIEQDGKSPSGFDTAALLADLKAVA